MVKELIDVIDWRDLTKDTPRWTIVIGDDKQRYLYQGNYERVFWERDITPGSLIGGIAGKKAIYKGHGEYVCVGHKKKICNECNKD